MNTAETVIYGNFYTVDANKPKAQAAAIANGVYTYVGDEAGVKSHVGNHGHLGGSGILFMCQLNDCKTVEAVRARLKVSARKPQ